MQQFFSLNYNGSPFVLFGTAHLSTIALIFIICILMLLYGRQIPPRLRPTFRYTLASLYLLNQLSFHFWMWWYDKWHVQTMLPLDFCSISGLLGALMLFRPQQTLYEWVYFIGIAGALQALLTPALSTYGVSHFLFIQFFISHTFIVIAPIYLMATEGFRPYIRSLLRIFIAGNLYMFCIGGINALLGSNYLFIAHKPETPSALDMLPAWPWYIFYMEIIAILCVCLLYLPFAWRDRGFIFQAPTTLTKLK